MSSDPAFRTRGIAFLVLLAVFAGWGWVVPGVTLGRAVGQAGSDGGEGATGGTVFLVTFGPGPKVYERFGHNALWFRDSLAGDGPAYDFGRFSFEEPGFVLNFARGRMFYWMGREASGAALINAYLDRGRSVWLQRLAIPPAAAAAMRDSLEAQLAREGGRYRYDYYRDNCSTRIRDAIDLATGGAVAAQLQSAPGGTTLRFHTRRSFQSMLPIYTGVMISLGPSVDRPISKWDEAFLPMELQEHLRGVTVTDSAGHQQPLVLSETAVAETDAYRVPDAPSGAPKLILPLIGVALGLSAAAVGRRASGSAGARRAFLALGGLWALAGTLLGLVLLGFWGFTDHVVTHRNANVFQFNLLSLALLVALSRLAAGRPRATRSARLFALAVVVGSVAGPVIELLLRWGQQNAEVTGLALPVHLGVYLGLLGWNAASGPAPSAAPPAPR